MKPRSRVPLVSAAISLLALACSGKKLPPKQPTATSAATASSSGAAPAQAASSTATPDAKPVAAGASKLVELGDRIAFPRADVQGADNVVRVGWSQDANPMDDEMQVDFFQVTAVLVDAKGAPPVMVFIEKAELPRLLTKCRGEGAACVLPVDKDFKYGQNKEKTFRFLVFEQDGYKPFQHRFVKVGLVKFANSAKGLAERLKGLPIPVPNADAVLTATTSSVQATNTTVGDPLRSF